MKFRPNRIRDYPAAVDGLKGRIRSLKPKSERKRELLDLLKTVRLKQLRSEINADLRKKKAST